jgi:hypothetical protein
VSILLVLDLTPLRSARMTTRAPAFNTKARAYPLSVTVQMVVISAFSRQKVQKIGIISNRHLPQSLLDSECPDISRVMFRT